MSSTRHPTQNELLALIGTSGTPSDTNPYVTDADPRLTGGDSVSVNDTGVANANFTDDNPAADAGFVNVQWQLDTTTSPDEISAQVPVGTTAGTVASGANLQELWRRMLAKHAVWQADSINTTLTLGGNSFGFGDAASGLGTASLPTHSDASLHANLHWSRRTSTGAANSAAGWHMPTGADHLMLSASSGRGDWVWFHRFSLGTAVTGERACIGIVSDTRGSTLGTGEPSSSGSFYQDAIAVGFDSGDSSAGNLFYWTRSGGGTATRVDCGANAPRTAGTIFDLEISHVSGSGEVRLRLYNVTSSTLAVDVDITATLPAAGTLMTWNAAMFGTGAGTACIIDFGHMHLWWDMPGIAFPA